MTIAIDARELRTSSGRYVERLLHYLQQIDQQHDYLVLLKPEDVAGWKPTNKRFKVIACPHKEFSFSEQLGFNRQLKALQPDLVHFTFPQQPIRYKGRKITTIHDLTTRRFSNPAKNPVIFKFKQLIYGQVIKSAVRRSAHVIAISQFTKNDVVKFAHIDPAKVTVTYESADLVASKSETVQDLLGKKFIMYVGRPTPHKNLEKLIEAFGQVLQGQPDLLLVLAGKKDANYQRIEQKASKLSYAKSIYFTDFIPDSQLRWLYENCQAYVFPSLSEGFGLPGLEAMVHGAPVISSNATCLPEIYGDAAVYFNPEDVHDMAAKISQVLTDPKTRQTLIDKGKNQVAKYSWAQMAEQTLEIYNRALSQ